MNNMNGLRTALWHLRKGGLVALRSWQRRRKNIAAETGMHRRTRVQKRFGIFPRPKVSSGHSARQYPEREPKRKDLRVAVILDEFSFMAFNYEWDLLRLSRKAWKDQLVEKPVNLLFVESAWNGNAGEWKYQLTGTEGPQSDLVRVVEYCKLNDIPTVFWNKEDPPHFDEFLETARLFDFVLTSDVRMIPKYEELLGHRRISVLPFAAQPVIHNPIRSNNIDHELDVAFAGTYFTEKFPGRRDQMQLLLGAAMAAERLSGIRFDIFSRFLTGGDRYQFPSPYDGHVAGSLTYQEMLTAYHAYKVFLNVNTVVDSESMCARRIFEISASGTPVISTRSVAVRHFFDADEVLIADTFEQGRDQIRSLVRSPELNDRTTHKAQRRIWSEHTYTHRAEEILRTALPAKYIPLTRPSVSALVSTFRPQQIEHIFQSIGSQTNVDLQLVLLTHGFEIDTRRIDSLSDRYGVGRVSLLEAGTDTSLGDCLNMCIDVAEGEVLSKIDDDDYYAPEYLSDLLYSLSYSNADIVGKRAHYMHFKNADATILRAPELEHTFTHLVAGPTITGRSDMFRNVRFRNLQRGEDTRFLNDVSMLGATIYSSDRFNYCQMRGSSDHTWELSDSELMASGEIKFFGDPITNITI